MRRVGLCAALVFLGWGYAQEPGVTPVLSNTHASPAPGRPPAPKEEAKEPEEPWLGISISKPGAAIYAQLTKVPKGVGFLIDQVEPAGPAMQVGLQRYDLLWKLDDQLLMNEGQFLSLLAMHEVGDTVRLTYFRGGENLEVAAVLAARPARAKGASEAERILMTPRVPGLPWQMVDVRERVAVLEDQAGVVKVSKRDGAFHWMSLNPESELTDRGRFAAPDETGRLQLDETLDPVLKNKLSALVRAYDQAAGRASGRIRMPRVRRVPEPQDGSSPGTE